jgi:hypothetical protein
MQVPDVAFAIEMVLVVVLFVRSLEYLADVGVCVDVSDQAKPPPARSPRRGQRARKGLPLRRRKCLIKVCAPLQLAQTRVARAWMKVR